MNETTCRTGSLLIPMLICTACVVGPGVLGELPQEGESSTQSEGDGDGDGPGDGDGENQQEALPCLESTDEQSEAEAHAHGCLQPNPCPALTLVQDELGESNSGTFTPGSDPACVAEALRERNPVELELRAIGGLGYELQIINILNEDIALAEGERVNDFNLGPWWLSRGGLIKDPAYFDGCLELASDWEIYTCLSEWSEGCGDTTLVCEDAGEPLITCGDAFPACLDNPTCASVAGPEVYVEPEGNTCSDLGLPFACALAECEPMEYAIICNDKNPADARWLLQQCMPEGWSSCLPEGCTHLP